jgi:hypothetical protein
VTAVHRLVLYFKFELVFPFGVSLLFFNPYLEFF